MALRIEINLGLEWRYTQLLALRWGFELKQEPAPATLSRSEGYQLPFSATDGGR